MGRHGRVRIPLLRSERETYPGSRAQIDPHSGLLLQANSPPSIGGRVPSELRRSGATYPTPPLTPRTALSKGELYEISAARASETEGSLIFGSLGDVDTFQGQHALFGHRTARRGEAANPAAGGQYAVAGDDQRHRVPRHRLADVARGFRPGAEFLRQRAVGGRPAPAERAGGGIDAAEEIVFTSRSRTISAKSVGLPENSAARRQSWPRRPAAGRRRPRSPCGAGCRSGCALRLLRKVEACARRRRSSRCRTSSGRRFRRRCSGVVRRSWRGGLVNRPQNCAGGEGVQPDSCAMLSTK